MLAGTSSAQELDPRVFAPAPMGTTIMLAGVGGSKGAIVFDPSVGAADVEADLHMATTGFGYTFALAGRQARVLAVFPIAWGNIAGEVADSRSFRTCTALRIRASRSRWACTARRRCGQHSSLRRRGARRSGPA